MVSDWALITALSLDRYHAIIITKGNRMQTIAIVSLAGGQGKTTVSHQLGLFLAQMGKTVLLIDSDPQATLSLFLLNQPLSPTAPTLLEVLQGDIATCDAIYPTRHANLFLMPADRGLRQAEKYLIDSGIGSLVLGMRLEEVATTFDFTIIDAPPQLSQVVRTATGAAQTVIIPIEVATKGTKSLDDTLLFIAEQQKLRAFRGVVAGAIPFRARWVGNSPTRVCQSNLEAIDLICAEAQIARFPPILESTRYQTALDTDSLVAGSYRFAQDELPLTAPFADLAQYLQALSCVPS